MSQAAMTDVELREFLSQPLIADIVTLKKDGSPQITPVDYYFDGTYLYFPTTTDRAKSRNIKREVLLTCRLIEPQLVNSLPSTLRIILS